MKTIRQLREDRGWTQKYLADLLGLTHVSVYNWERGQHMPTAPQLRALAKAFGVSMDDIDFESPMIERKEKQ